MKKKIIFGSVIGAIVLTGFLVGYIFHIIQRNGMISEAQSLFNKGQYLAVIDHLNPGIEEGSRSAEERILIGKSFYRLRQYDEALKALDPLLRTGREDAKALALSGWIWIKKNSPLQAQTKFDKAAALGEEAEAEGGLGALALVRSENYRSEFLNEALFHLKKSIALDPGNAKVYLVMAELSRLQHKYSESIEWSKKAVELAPYWSEPYRMLGSVYLLDGKYSDAENTFLEGQKHGGSKEETQYYLAHSVYYQGRLNESLALFEELINHGKEKVRDALIDAAKVALVVDEKKAIDYLKRAWSMKSDPITGMQLYEALSRENRTSEAEKILESVLSDWPFLGLAHLERGHTALQDKDFNRAYLSYQSVLENDSRNYLANNNLGYLAPLRSSMDQAPGYFESVVRDYQDFFPALVNLVLGQLSADRGIEAEKQLTDLLLIYPDNAYLLLASALERFAAGDAVASLELLDRSLSVGNSQSVIFVIRGEIQLRLFQFEKAKSSFEQALLSDPKNLRAKLGKAHALYRLGDYGPAEITYQELFSELSSLSEIQQIEVRNGLAVTSLEKGNYEKTTEILETLKNSSGELGRQFYAINAGLLEENLPTADVLENLKVAAVSNNALPEVFYNLAVFLNTLDQPDKSIESYEILYKKYPGYLPGLYNLANLYRFEGRKGDSVLLYDLAQKAAPDMVEVYNNQAVVYQMMNQLDRAKMNLDEAGAIDQNYSEIIYNKILLALIEHNLADAEKMLLELKSYNLSSVAQMADGLIEGSKGNWQKAEPIFASAINDNSDDAYSCLNHGVALVKLKEYSKAEAAFREAIRRDPSLSSARKALGLLYCELGLFKHAEEQLNVALRLDPLQTDIKLVIDRIQGWMKDI